MRKMEEKIKENLKKKRLVEFAWRQNERVTKEKEEKREKERLEKEKKEKEEEEKE
jgi:hypothetical protein